MSTLLCRSRATVSRGLPASGGAVGGLGDQAREADELRVELLVEHAGGALGGVDRLQRARDVGAVGVVLRAVDLAARREQDDERDADPERRRRPPARAVQRSRGPVPPRIANATSSPSESAREHRHADQRLQVAGDRVAGLVADVAGRPAAALGDPA